MKRILFYVALLIQVAMITIFIFQFERINVTGTEITITTKEKDEHDTYDFPLQDGAYVQYDISNISDEIWSGATDLDYGETVYVRLDKWDDQHHEVVEASNEKIKQTNEETIVIQASYGYYNRDEKLHEVNYNFQYLDNINRFGSFNYLDDLIVTLYVGKWGQYKVTDISINDE